MRFAQISWDKAHWIFEAEDKLEWPPGPEGEPIVIVDVTAKPEVQEGWLFDAENGEFTAPPEPEPQPLPSVPDFTPLSQPMAAEDTTALQAEVKALREQMSTLISLLQQKGA